MLMIPILDTAPEPGELVRFEVPAPVLKAATAAATLSPAPPSYMQESHVRRLLAQRAEQQQHAESHWVGILFDIPGRIDTAAMAVALTKWAQRHPTLLTWFSIDDSADRPSESDERGTGQMRRHAVDPSAVSIEPVSLGGYDSPEAIRDWLLEFFDTSTDPLSWPPFAIAAVVREASSTLYYAVDHCHADGLSALFVFGELRQLYEAEVAGVEAQLPKTASYVDFCALERERSAQLSVDSPEIHRWLEFFLGGSPSAFPLPLGTEPGRTYPRLTLTLDLLDAAESDAFAKVCKANGSGFSAGVLATLGITGHELAGCSSYRGLSVVHTRDEMRWAWSQGWFVKAVPVEFPTADLPFGELLSGANAAFIKAREMASITPLQVAELFPEMSLEDALVVLPIVSYGDMRHAPGSRDWADANCHGIAGQGTISHVPIWVNRLWDRTYVTAAYPDTPAARTNVPRFLEHLRDVMLGIARTGEHAHQALEQSMAGD